MGRERSKRRKEEKLRRKALKERQREQRNQVRDPEWEGILAGIFDGLNLQMSERGHIPLHAHVFYPDAPAGSTLLIPENEDLDREGRYNFYGQVGDYCHDKNATRVCIAVEMWIKKAPFSDDMQLNQPNLDNYLRQNPLQNDPVGRQECVLLYCENGDSVERYMAMIHRSGDKVWLGDFTLVDRGLLDTESAMLPNTHPDVKHVVGNPFNIPVRLPRSR